MMLFPQDKEKFVQRVKEGDFGGILDWLAANPSLDHETRSTVIDYLRQAVSAAAKKDGEDFSDQVLGQLCAFATEVCLRLQSICQRELDDARYSDKILSPDASMLLTRCKEAMELVVSLSFARAKTARMWTMRKPSLDDELPFPGPRGRRKQSLETFADQVETLVRAGNRYATKPTNGAAAHTAARANPDSTAHPQ